MREKLHPEGFRDGASRKHLRWIRLLKQDVHGTLFVMAIHSNP